jgi:hypothetical protein
MMEKLKQFISALHSNVFAMIAKALIVLLAAFSLYVIIKNFGALSSMAEENMSDAGDELDSLQISSLFDTNNHDPTNNFLRSFLMVVLSVGKVLIMGSTMFATFLILEANALLPTTALCFIYGLLIGCAGGYYYGTHPFPRSKRRSFWQGIRKLEKRREVTEA